jgi:hypothetical protein
MPVLARIKPYAQLMAAAFVALIGVSVGVTAVGHAFDPQHIGLWSGPYSLSFGSMDNAIHAHQLPGSTLYIVTVMVVGICWFVSRELVEFARAALARQAR